ncbi:hypothetical protein CSC70_04320 [Pseudoxanthomonas kalamensis DSM 18571]|uniref:SGNH/GDSL hydrolase family protein n=1 Tax=Pseudoxanthomonas kalamensis TaxID=289483 RepID=UPI0013916034|nr:SGNH/GDSL hydrolase family protein [Pseudoxanthomonas kalamensis]KAF1711154.1 hypothetical protein CSC70_04320 [Pseudoxanthomonas kalamensis DSM 18571]
MHRILRARNVSPFPLLVPLLLLLLAACATSHPEAAAPAAPTVSAPQVPAQVSNAGWEQDMQRFAAEDAVQPPPRGGILFVGSSSIRMWKSLAQDFPGLAVVNRGFGGSEIRDSTWYADRIVVPYAPRQIVLYAGDNDINSGRSPEQLLADFRAFVTRVRRDLPDVAIAYISCKPSLARAEQLATQRQANALIAAEIAGMRNAAFVDVFTPMLDAQGQPRPELFIEDGLHMNATGYALWRERIDPVLLR